jgi:GAF domain-containing protein
MVTPHADALLASITQLGRRIFGAAACSIALLEPDEEHLVFRAASGEGADEVVGLRLPVSRGIAGWVVSSGQPIAVHDVRADPRFAADVAESTGYVPQSILAAPVTSTGEAFGVMEVLDGADHGRDGLDLLVLLAAHAATAIQVIDRTPLAPSPDPTAAWQTAMASLGPHEQRAAAALLGEFLDFLGRRGGPAGVV